MSNISDMMIKPDDEAPHILVVDDDRRLRELLSQYLSNNGFRVSNAKNSFEAKNKIENLEFDLLIVDVMMPGESGIELTKSLREIREVPILMLTALASTENKIEGLEAGADDYLPKPFEPRELVLRINSILKRTVKPDEPAIAQINFGDYQFNVKRTELTHNDNLIKLTDREREILTIFAAKPGETIARNELLGSDNQDGERKIDVQINRLRRKIEEDPANPKWLQTVRGVGYRLIIDG